jgi:hypothetical protein
MDMCRLAYMVMLRHRGSRWAVDQWFAECEKQLTRVQEWARKK